MGIVNSQMMEDEARGWSDPEKYVCDRCVEDEFLKDVIRGQVVAKQCDYCQRRSKKDIAAPVAAILEPIAETVLYYYNEPTQAGVPWEGGWIFEPKDTADILYSLGLECEESLLSDIENAFINTAWVEAAGGHWASSHDNQVLYDSWNSFVNVVKHEIRYFFNLVDRSDVAGPQEFAPRHVLPAIAKVIRELVLTKLVRSGTRYYRVRERGYGADWEVSPATMGAPPPEVAAAGRMNPPGISYLYLAHDKGTSIAEVVRRPPIDLVIAEFKTTEDFLVLDLSDMPDMPSLFDSDNRRTREGLLFLNQFVQEISQPVRKDGQEHIDYVPSQVICEYFAMAYHLEKGVERVRGIIYPSAVREGGKNLVLFPTQRSLDRDFSNVAYEAASEMEINTWVELIELVK